MKIRSDFVTNSSSSSFVTFDIESKTFASIIKRFQEEIEEQGWFQIGDLSDTSVSMYGDEMMAETPINIKDIVPSLARLFYEEIYIPGEYMDEYEEEEAREAFEAELEDIEDDYDFNLELRIAKAIIDEREKIEEDLESINMSVGSVGYGGDDDSRYDKDNYDEDYLASIYETIAEENGCSVEDVTDDDFSYYVGVQTSQSEETYTYNKKTGKEKHSKDFSLM